MESGDGEDVADFVVDIPKHQCSTFCLDILKDAQEDTQARTADVFQAAALNLYRLVGILMYGSELFLALCGLQSVETAAHDYGDFSSRRW